MLSPKKVKYRKQMKGNTKGKACRGQFITFGDYGIIAVEPAWVTNRQLEAARIAIARYIKKGAKVWIRVFPDKPFTRKPAETRMGSGKGSPEGWVAVVQPGRVIIELAGADAVIAREALRRASQKLPCKCNFLAAEE